jgi:hypothetical protein
MVRIPYYFFGLAAVAALQVMGPVSDTLGREESAEWSVSARCLPHAEVAAPQSIQIRVAFSTNREGPELSALMAVHGIPDYSSSTDIAYWGVPQRKWVSFIFGGPPITNKYFCQQDWGDKPLHLRYNQSNNLKLFLSITGALSDTELDFRESSKKSVLVLHPQDGSTTYSAGTGTSNPYWLQFAIPIYGNSTAMTTLFCDFL